eukprot:TRINITY_DN2451_c0_g1_i13.p1 TRINITY_DN2451_c0_g1~~TRINITY_DN2451_c0_g1_i13.p1  ORF type:complete len:115 (-),score=17.31 TRINITY_DN2451_c0_g1_i13:128-472(-)
MPSPTWLHIGVTAEKDFSKGEGCSWVSRLRLKAQLSVLSPSSFLRIPLTACSSAGVRGKTCPLTLHCFYRSANLTLVTSFTHKSLPLCFFCNSSEIKKEGKVEAFAGGDGDGYL